MGAGKAQPFTEHRRDWEGAGAAEAGLSGRGTAVRFDGGGTAGTGARQGWTASAPQGAEAGRGGIFTNGNKGYIGLDIYLVLI
jgi:hypothetical protein